MLRKIPKKYLYAGIVPDQNIYIHNQQAHHLMTIRNTIMEDNSHYNGYLGHIFFGHDAAQGL